MYKKKAAGQNKGDTSVPAPSARQKDSRSGSTGRIINDSPAQAAQAKKIAQLFPAAVQRQTSEEDEYLQGKFPVQQQADGETLQAAAGDSPANATASPANTSGIPVGLQVKMGSALNTDLSGVTVHPNSHKAVEVGALAYTQGSDIHFAPGQYNPSTSAGKKLIGHEVAHVVQQAEGRVQPTGEIAGLPLNDSPALEKEADNLASKL